MPIKSKQKIERSARLSVAPMMDWTDTHCRFFHRLLCKNALLYTEMVTSAALIRGGATHLLAYDPAEHPIALQLGGCDPDELAAAARLGASYGYDEINLNVGCPSDRVQSGAFGAVLMKSPDLVAKAVAAMRADLDIPVSVKCRIGVDDQSPEQVLPEFLEAIRAAGCNRVIIHARKAWLQGLSPKENRDIPPLDYALVFEMKRMFPDLHISINGGITSLEQVQKFLEQGLDGVMIGRAAYQRPGTLLSTADAVIFKDGVPCSCHNVVREMFPYIEKHLSTGGRLSQVTRHMLGLFHGLPGARQWRQILSQEAHVKGAGLAVLERALASVPEGEEGHYAGS